MEFSENISSVCFTGHRDLTEKEIYIISKRLTALLNTLLRITGCAIVLPAARSGLIPLLPKPYYL